MCALKTYINNPFLDNFYWELKKLSKKFDSFFNS